MELMIRDAREIREEEKKEREKEKKGKKKNISRFDLSKRKENLSARLLQFLQFT